MKKWYQAKNANRLIAGQSFTITDIVGGSAWGIFETENPKIIQDLDALVADPASGVSSMTEAEFSAELEVKKKLDGWPTLSESKTKREIGTSLKAPAGVVQEGRDDPPEDPDKPIEIKQGVTSVDEALSTVKVEPSQPITVQEQEAKPAKKPKVKS